MINDSIIKKAAEGGFPALKDLFEKLPKEDALKGLAIVGASAALYKFLEFLKDIVLGKA